MVTDEEKDQARKALLQAYQGRDMDAAGRATAVLRAWLAERVDKPVTAKVTRRRSFKRGADHASVVPGL